MEKKKKKQAIPHPAGMPFKAFLSDPYGSHTLSVTLGLRHRTLFSKGHLYMAFPSIYF